MGKADDPVFSRAERASIFGKRTRDTRTQLSDATKEKLAVLWRERGYRTESEYLAELIEVHVHGVHEVEKLHVDRVRALAGIGSENGALNEA